MTPAETKLTHYGCDPLTAQALGMSSRRHGLAMSTLVAVCFGESAFRNVWGHDHGKFREDGPVTQAGIARYYRAAPTARPNGIGPMQLTSPSLQSQALHAGGLHVPAVTIDVGAQFLAGLVRQFGEHDGLMHYNGSGPAAVAYAASRLAAARTWHLRLT